MDLAHVTQRKIIHAVYLTCLFYVELRVPNRLWAASDFDFFLVEAQTSEVWFSPGRPEPIFREGMTTLTSPKIASQS